MRIRIEYCSEGGGDPKAIELYSNGEKRELTYEAMDEVLKADILETELMAITGLMDRLDLSREHIPCRLADAITLSYENSRGACEVLLGRKGLPAIHCFT